nr:hypothetical protein [uncultured Campylobacter sp.]
MRFLKFKSEISKGAVAVRNTCAQQTAQNLNGRSSATQAASNLNKPLRRRTDISPRRSEIEFRVAIRRMRDKILCCRKTDAPLRQSNKIPSSQDAK